MSSSGFLKIVSFSFFAVLTLGGVYVAHAYPDLPFSLEGGEIIIQNTAGIPNELRGVISSVPDGAIVIVSSYSDGYKGYIVKNNNGTDIISWFNTRTANSQVKRSYNEALKILNITIKEIPCVANLLNKKPLNYINLEPLPSSLKYGGHYDQFWNLLDPAHASPYDTIATNPRLSSRIAPEVIRHELTHWINRDCGRSPLCEVATGLVETYSGVDRPPFNLELFCKKVSQYGFLDKNAFKNSLLEYMSGKGVLKRGGSDDFNYIISSLLGDELEARIVSAPGKVPSSVIGEVQKLVDAAHSVSDVDVMSEKLGFKSFDDLNATLEKRYRVTKGYPTGLPVSSCSPAMQGIKTIARVADKANIVLGAAVIIYDLATTDAFEKVINGYYEAKNECQYKLWESPGLVFDNVFNQKMSSLIADLGFDDLGRLILPKDPVTGESILDSDFEKQVRSQLEYIKNNKSCRNIFTDIQKAERYKDFRSGLFALSIYIPEIHGPRSSELRQAPVNWWVDIDDAYIDRGRPYGSGGKLK